MKTAATAGRASPSMRSAVRQSLSKNMGASGEPPLPVHPVTAMHIDRRLVSDGNTHARCCPDERE
jgi:hypothetical protein